MNSWNARIVLFLATLGALAAAVPAPGQDAPEKYVWSFKNFLAEPCIPADPQYPWERYRETFIGIPSAPIDNLGFDALLYQILKDPIFRKGHCFGMDLTSLLINERGGTLGFCGPVGDYEGSDGATTENSCTNSMGTADLGPTNPRLIRAIQELHGHQVNLTVLRYLIDHTFQDGNDIYRFVQKNTPCLISMITDKGGHVLLAYQTEDLGSEKHIRVYDPNRSWGSNKDFYDNGENFLKIDSNGGWDYDFSGNGNPHWNTGVISAFPLSIVAPRDRSAASLGLSVSSILGKVHFSSGGASLDQVTDGQGKRLFRPGTKELERNPQLGMLSAVPLYQMDGDPGAGASGGGEFYFFLDPRAGPFDFQVRGEAGYELLLATSLGFLRVSGQGARGVDHVQVIDPASREPSLILFNAIGSSSMEAEIASSESLAGRRRDFKLSNISMPGSGLVTLKLGRDRDRVQVESPLHEVSFALSISQTDAGATTAVEKQGVTLPAGARAALTPSSWSDLTHSDIRVATSTLTAGAVEARCAQLYGPGKGPVGADFWDSRDIGGGLAGVPAGSTTYDPRTGIYTQVSSGEVIGAGGDGFQFAYAQVEGDFEFTAEVVDRIDPPIPAARLGRHGLMARRDCTPASRFSHLQTMTGGDVKDWPRWAFRPVHGDSRSGDDHQQFNYDPDQRPRFLKMVRRGSTFHGFLSRDGKQWDPLGSNTWQDGVSGPILVGFASTSGVNAGGAPSTIRFKVLGLGPIETALPLPLPDGGAAAGQTVFQSDFQGPEGSPPPGFSIQKRSGAFTPALRGNRLRLSDEAFPGSAVSALSAVPLEDLDSGLFQFDFDLFLARGPGADPGEGVTFTVLAGNDPRRVGLPGGALGYDGIGREIGTDRNLSTGSFSVEFDTVSDGGPNPGRGSPEFPRSLHVGINGQNNVGSVVQTSDGLPDPFAPEGIHARIRYNRGRVQVLLGAGGAGGAGGGALVPVLAADLLPISFAAPGDSAVFGYTASTGDFTETAEVDGLTVTRIGCGEKTADISGMPAGPVAPGTVVVLDGSGSRGGPGEEDQPLTESWTVVSGPAVIVGPSDGPTVNLKPLAAGQVTVRLTVDGLRCSNPASKEVTVLVEGAPAGRWIRCDCSGDGLRDITDPITLLSWLYLGAADPGCTAACDCSSDGQVDITDAIFDLGFQFLAGPPPAPPYPACDVFPTCGDGCPEGR